MNERERDGLWVVEFIQDPDWNLFPILVDMITSNFQAQIMERYDGPDARRWVIEVENVVIEMLFDDVFGIWLEAPIVHQQLAHRIGEVVISELKAGRTPRSDGQPESN